MVDIDFGAKKKVSIYESDLETCFYSQLEALASLVDSAPKHLRQKWADEVSERVWAHTSMCRQWNSGNANSSDEDTDEN